MKPIAPRRDERGGFALIEVMLALMLIAVLAALALPGLNRATGSAALHVTALQVSAVLREDRNVAESTRRVVSTMVDRAGGRIVSGASSAVVTMPAGVVASLIDSAAPSVRFFADGRSSGGAILIAAAEARYLVLVNPDTGAIRVGEP